MKCFKHPDKDGFGACVYCGKIYCEDCLVEIQGRMYCKEDLSKSFDEINANIKRKDGYSNRKASSSNTATFTASTIKKNDNSYSNKKSRATVLILCVLGLHRFYTHNLAQGLLFLFTMGGFLIWWIKDLCNILDGSYIDGRGELLLQTQIKI